MTVFPACATCARFNREDKMQEVCEAFPKGIPEEIIGGSNNHRKPFPGDKGLIWKPIAGWTEDF